MISCTSVFKPTVAACVVLAVLVASASAADKADPNGTWKWIFTTPDGQETPLSLLLKLDGEKLTGAIQRGDELTDISDGTFVDDEVVFNVVREQDGNKITARFKGKVEADSITGKIDVQVGDNNLTFDWNATREKK